MQFIQFLIAIMIAFVGGKLIQKISLPAILGWLITGIIIGPNVINVLSSNIMNSGWYTFLIPIVNIIVGIMLGSNLDWQRIKQTGTQILTLTLSEITTTFIVVSGAFAVLFYFMEIPIILSLLIGGIATATAPAPPVSVVSEYETDGPVTRSLLPLTVLDSVIVSAFFFTLASILESMFSDSSGSLLLLLAMMLIVPILYGALAGYLVSIFVDKEHHTRKNLVFFLIGTTVLIVGALLIDYVLYPEPMMTHLLIGIGFMGAFVNMTNDRVEDDVYTVYGQIESVALMILIVNLAAPLDPSSLLSAGLASLFYLVVRAIGKLLGTYAAAKAQNMDPNVQKYLGITILPHAGISLVYAGTAASVAALLGEEYGTFIQTVIPAAALVNEIIAILLSKKVFEWSGEIGGRTDPDDNFVDEQSNHKYQQADQKYYDS